MTPSARPILCVSVPSPAHDLAEHPEHAGRVPAILSAVEDDGLLPELAFLGPSPLASRIQLGRCHAPSYVEGLERAMAAAPGFLDPAPTYVTPDSYRAAREAAGACIALVEALLADPARPGLALVRPPGHHARPGGAMGFCLLGNIALAARAAQDRGIGRVMIVDFDVHHGNGTQEIFYADDSVLFVSSHESGIYPGTGFEDEIGQGPGRGTTINCPFPALAGDRAVRECLRRIIVPAAERFRPELLLVSAGFDAHFRDPLASLQVSGSGYHALTRGLAELADRHCQGRLAFVLEGGYDLEALGNGVVNVLRALTGRPAETGLGPAPWPEPEAKVTALLDRVVARHGLD